MKLKKTGSKEHIVLNQDLNEKLIDKTDIGLGYKSEGSVLWGIASGSISVNIDVNKFKAWQNSTKRLEDQLRELNDLQENKIEWKFDGEKIIPKSLNVAKIVRGSFNKTFSFQRIRREVYTSSYNKSFALYTNRMSDGANWMDLIEEIKNLREDIKNNRDTIMKNNQTDSGDIQDNRKAIMEIRNDINNQETKKTNFRYTLEDNKERILEIIKNKRNETNQLIIETKVNNAKETLG